MILEIFRDNLFVFVQIKLNNNKKANLICLGLDNMKEL